MKIKVSFLTILVGFILTNNCINAQTFRSGVVMKMNGYVVNVGGKILFQPCEDATKNIWQSLDHRSFPLYDFREQLYIEAISNIGDSAKVYCFDSDDQKQYYMNLSYFYCALQVDMMLLDSIKFEVFRSPKYKITYDNSTYHAYGFNIDNRIQKIIPKDKTKLKLLYNYYSQRNYVVPDWLYQALHKRKNDLD